jgi:zinc transport system permease protein
VVGTTVTFAHHSFVNRLLAIALPYPFDRPFMQLALVAGVAVGIGAPLLGTFLVERRMSLIGDGIGHVAFAGVSVGLFTGTWPIGAALVVAVLGAVLLEVLRSSGRAAGDLALAVLLYAGVGGGVVLAGAAGSYNASVLQYLFGSPLSVTTSEAQIMVVLCILIIGLIGWKWRTLLAVVTDADFARTIGINVRVIDLALAVGTALVIVASMRVVGVMLVGAMIVLPVGTARLLAPSFLSALVGSSFIGALMVIAGLSLARTKGLPAGGTIVCLGVVTVALAATLSWVRSKLPSATR